MVSFVLKASIEGSNPSPISVVPIRVQAEKRKPINKIVENLFTKIFDAMY
jgi:hypothetical protein